VTASDAAPGIFDLPLNFQNDMKGWTYGAEVTATWQGTDFWRLYGAYTFLRMRLRAASSLGASAETAANQSPRHQVYVQSSWNLVNDIEVDLMGRVVDRLSGFGPPVPRYASIDARVGWRPHRRLEVALVGRNLLDPRHPEFGTAPLLSSLLVEIERSVSGGIAWDF
jgi:iron complex outermembrane receptor protein